MRRRRRRGIIHVNILSLIGPKSWIFIHDIILLGVTQQSNMNKEVRKQQPKTRLNGKKCSQQLSGENTQPENMKGEFTANGMLSDWITPTHRSSCSLVHSASLRFCWTRRLTCCCSSSLSLSSSIRRLSISCWILAGLSAGSVMLSSLENSDCDPC